MQTKADMGVGKQVFCSRCSLWTTHYLYVCMCKYTVQCTTGDVTWCDFFYI